MSQSILLSINEACEFLGVGKSTIYKLVKDGKLQICKIYSKNLFRRSDLEEFASALGRTPEGGSEA